ncbi:DUF2568 domain-containing protein [Tepidiforma sp.]|uniref:DUF2568 domain-containing protein n=1 Tax=Tepidiforma sp. TaxID=2682230 RepID=UPI002ADD3A8B|nr:DUF2568 domain-containing protein [Tepidiforma sp.]
MRETVHGFALGVRFLLELALLTATAAGTARVVPGPTVARVAAGLAAAAAVGAAWGLFVSPRARFEVGPAGRLAIEAGLFAGAGLLLAAAGWPRAGALLVVAAIIDGALVRLTR